jgi:uncharacterized protein YdcH (DUF465 family)
MSMTLPQVREQLLSRDTVFQQLVDVHSRYETQLKQLSQTPYLSSEDILLQANLKKMKLRVKDEIERRLAAASKSGI